MKTSPDPQASASLAPGGAQHVINRTWLEYGLALLAALLLAMLALGSLLAFVGQSYQTGADPWQLFATWAALSLPWAFFGRSDALWALWVLVAGTALGLWSGQALFDPLGTLLHGHGSRHFIDSLAWLALVALPVALTHRRLIGPPAAPRPATASLRLAAFLAVNAWSAYALWALFARAIGSSGNTNSMAYLFNVALVFAAAGAAWIVRSRDFVVLAGVVLALNIVFLGLVFKLLFFDSRAGDLIGTTLLFTLIAAASIGGGSVWLYRAQHGVTQEDRR